MPKHKNLQKIGGSGDTAYMEAVERGDMETAQRMVDEAARTGMPKTKISNKAITGYPKGNATSAIREAIVDDRILYLDEKRSQTHLAGMKGSNYPTAARKADFTNHIRRFWENVKWKIRENRIDIKNTGKTRYVIAASGKIISFDSIMAVATEEYVLEGGRKAFYLHEILIKIKIPHQSWPTSREPERQAKYLLRTVYAILLKKSTAMISVEFQIYLTKKTAANIMITSAQADTAKPCILFLGEVL